jgi:UDP-N-acetylmuramoyl-L-alanyl-D-glutamate--2,6-diaminopimelate ligase
VEKVPEAELHGDGSLSITSIAYDSRRVVPGTLFVAIHGHEHDGNDFVEPALRKGALAVASENPPQEGTSWIRVPNAREALALLSAALMGEPASALTLVGVTGTNGKTTTAHLVDAAIRAAGHTVGLLGTVQYRIGTRLAEATRTTPESSDLQALFREMVQEGCSHAVLEVSSHSLALARVHGCAFRVAVFTNLTRDHLDFHEDMEHYYAAKRRLFDTLLPEGGHAIINADDDRAADLIRACRGKVWTYSLERLADLKAEAVSLSMDGAHFMARTPLGSYEVHTRLLGRFNVQNALAALGAALALGVPTEAAVSALGSLAGVPGRMERVQAGQDFTVIVDYAHTDDALRNLLETLRALKPRRLITVFGCGGDRDRTKRPLMGAVASRLSDVVVVTSDNPRSEPPEAILEEIQRGMSPSVRTANGTFGEANSGRRVAERHVIADRREAIERAVELARPGDVVVIAGKGHETYQVLRDRTVPFDDRQVARDVLTRPALRSGKG